MQYTYVSPDGQTWFGEDHETMEDAYREAVEIYGRGVLIRETWYKEWICGTYQPGQRCGYDKYGNHVTAEEMENIGGNGGPNSPQNSGPAILPVIKTLKKATERTESNV